MKEQLLARIKDRTAVVGVVGLGYVGLPLAMEFAKAGFTVIGYDVSQRTVDALMTGASHIQDVPDEAVAAQVKAGRFVATTVESQLRGCDAISIAVPTPLSKSRDPDMSYVEAATLAIARNARAGMLVVLESTTYPGTTREVLQPRIEELGLVVGQDVFLAFSPERVDPGNPTWHTKNTPKVVGGVTASCTEVAAAFYSACIDTVVPVASAEVAELVKLMENTFRAVNIGLVNEMAVVCDKLGVNVWEVINAAATKPFGYMKFTPGPGIGGHCIPLDPLYLAWKMRTLNYRTRFIDLASDINSEMPEYVVRKVARALNDDRKSVRGARVLILGVAYKKDIDDMRESPALEVMRLLSERGAQVDYHDPWVPSFREHGVTHTGVALTVERLAQTDAVVIVTDHSNVDYQVIADHAPLVMDARNAMTRARPSRARVVPLSAP
ncbi:MAG: nucleotide sugar dehydrogenase [Gemmatimonadaceae bacterium]|nr:nucleotide sugar dehydrogenase [Gemmatimonadaceae bacterium]